MSSRQQIGLRKKAPPTTRAPGRKRRQALLDSARELLGERDIDDVSFRDIAGRAGVPEGSAYHFFANRYDLFAALACQVNDEFAEAHRVAVPESKRQTPKALAEHMVDTGARVYAKNAAARQLFIGSKTPLEIKNFEGVNDIDVAEAMYRSFSRYFDIADSKEMRGAFFYFIGITDLMFTLSVSEHGRITPDMLAEAKRAGVAYLETYLS